MWPLFAHNVPNSGSFRKIFDTRLQKDLVYFHTEIVLHSSYTFGIITHLLINKYFL